MTQSIYQQVSDNPAGMGQATLRDVLIPSILGKQTSGILYWAGKDLARQFPVAQLDEIPVIFKQLGFGELTLVKKNPKQQYWQLSGAIVNSRLSLKDADFNLECGFLAQELEIQTNATTEAKIDDKKRSSLTILVQHDLKETVADADPVKFINVVDDTQDED
ncbi:YslB family protein [Paucilactobacillus sp. N302-9]